MTTVPVTRSPRATAGACAGLVLAAALLWGGSAAVWYRVTPAGRAPVELTGAQLSPSLGGVALLALAGVAGVVATAGVLRRVVGVLLAAAGVAVGVVAVTAMVVDPFATGGVLPRPPAGLSAEVLRNQPADPTPAPLLAVAGGLVLLAVGVLVVAVEPRLSRFGARYAPAGSPTAVVDPDRAAWQDLDAGRDPTDDPGGDPSADPTGDRGDDPGGGTRMGPV